jgi:MFS family permease
MRDLEAVRHKDNFNRRKVRMITGLSLLLGFLDAFFLYVLSSYFATIVRSEDVSGFYLAAFIIVLILLANLQPLVQSVGKARLLLFFVALAIGTSFTLSLTEPSWIGAGLVIAFLIANNGMWVVMDVILEDFSSDHVSGRIRGFYLTIMNAGFLFAPFLSTRVLDGYGYPGVFTVLTIGYALILVAALFLFSRHVTAPRPRIPFIETLRRASRSRDFLRIYHISCILEFFYVVMVIYSPIYLLSLGFSWTELGIIFTIMLIPFVLVQYPLGILADTNWGEKELLFGSLALLALSTLLVGWVHTPEIIVWGAILFATRLGAAAIEILRDSYFYKQIDGNDADLVALFRTARPVANLVSALLTLALLAVLPVRALFFVVALVAVSGLFSAAFLRDHASEREQKQGAL